MYPVPVRNKDKLQQRLVGTCAEFQQSMVMRLTTDQWQKKLEACICAEGGHFEQLL